MSTPSDPDLRALDLFEAWLEAPEKRARLLAGEAPDVRARFERLEAGHAARGAMPTEMPDSLAPVLATPPERIGVFRLAERIGQGGMGDVWRGERDDGLFEQTVAIKLIQAHLDDRAREAFEAERRILARLAHPGIVRLTDGGMAENGLPYLIMDHVEGAPLDAAAAALPLAQRVTLFREAAAAVQFAHSRFVAHADLKPSNIMVDSEGHVRLLDFGIASLLGEDGEAKPPTGAMTREFASPQRLDGAPPSIADDVFALGKVLALIIAGDGDDDLTAIAAMATALEEADRYPTVAQVSTDLEHWQTGKPVSARRGNWLYRARKYVGRHRIGVAASVLAILALLGTTAYALISANRAERARAEAAARYDDARGTARYLLFELMPRLEDQPNSLALRSEVADVAQRYLDRLSKAKNADASVRLEAATGLIRLAEAQGVPGLPNLASPIPAARNLDRALALLADQKGPQARDAEIAAHLARARLKAFVDQDIDGALASVASAKALIAANPEVPVLLKGRTLLESAGASGEKGGYNKVMAEGRSALALLPDTDALPIMIERYRALDLIAEATYYAQSDKAALAPYQAAMAYAERMHAAHPRSRIARQRLGRSRWGLASTMLALDDRNDAALALMERNLIELAALQTFDPDDQETARLLQMQGLDRGSALADTGRIDAGIAALRDNIDLRKNWLARKPGEVRRKRDLLVGVKALGDVQVNHGRIANGCATYREVRALIDDIGKSGKMADMDIAYTINGLAKSEAKFCPGMAQKK